MVKTRRHSNNKGFRQIKRGKTNKQVKMMALRMKKDGLYVGPVL